MQTSYDMYCRFGELVYIYIIYNGTYADVIINYVRLF
jgi:hypothetical protein